MSDNLAQSFNEESRDPRVIRHENVMAREKMKEMVDVIESQNELIRRYEEKMKSDRNEAEDAYLQGRKDATEELNTRADEMRNREVEMCENKISEMENKLLDVFDSRMKQIDVSEPKAREAMCSKEYVKALECYREAKDTDVLGCAEVVDALYSCVDSRAKQLARKN